MFITLYTNGQILVDFIDYKKQVLTSISRSCFNLLNSNNLDYKKLKYIESMNDTCGLLISIIAKLRDQCLVFYLTK